MTQKAWTTAELCEELARYHAELLAAGNHRPSTVATYIQHPERFIAYLEGSYDPRRPQGRNGRLGTDKPVCVLVPPQAPCGAARDARLCRGEVVIGQPDSRRGV